MPELRRPTSKNLQADRRFQAVAYVTNKGKRDKRFNFHCADVRRVRYETDGAKHQVKQQHVAPEKKTTPAQQTSSMPLGSSPCGAL